MSSIIQSTSGAVVDAIGVSGGTADDDHRVAAVVASLTPDE
jgi:uncharacterized protein GlcG (DUF336 family)